MITRKTALWALGVIFLANFFNYTDRQLVSALETDIQVTLGLSLDEHGLLWTLFTLGYMLCAVPMGILAARLHRPRLFAVCVVIWSAATILSGAAPNKWILFASRILIGVGEAGCLVIGPTLITDYFDQKQRGRALSIFFLGLPLGGTAAFIIPGLLKGLPGFGWREMFYLVGAPGFLIAALIWYLPDPPRDQGGGGEEDSAGPHAHGAGNKGGFSDYLEVLKTPTVMLIILAQAFGTFMLIPLVHFGKEFLSVGKNMSEEGAQLAIGLISLIAGVVASLLAGVIGDRLARRSKGAYALLASIAYLLALPCLYFGIYSQEKVVYLSAIGGGAFFLFFCIPVVNAQIANAVKSSLRGTAFALAVFILHLFGDTTSPYLFGKANEEVAAKIASKQGVNPQAINLAKDRGLEPKKDPEALKLLKIQKGPAREKVFGWFVFALIPASLCCFIAIFTAKRDVERASGERDISLPVPHL